MKRIKKKRKKRKVSQRSCMLTHKEKYGKKGTHRVNDLLFNIRNIDSGHNTLFCLPL